ncbi:hypothetical protein [Streptomyces anulatus]|uniref:hypothetical protein n=1 Tax=Streptomyces anulatus TaxID=1892 RepID=UPI00167B8B5A|nr:hypothetical protein [Streptomyces anulatus]GGY39179.1 hypothetical protein GCM10010342_28100 [Streptomyces anulatus]
MNAAHEIFGPDARGGNYFESITGFGSAEDCEAPSSVMRGLPDYGDRWVRSVQRGGAVAVLAPHDGRSVSLRAHEPQPFADHA